MIVISGALVLMAAVLLFIGLLAGSSLTAIYVSIGLSIVAAVFLWLGINQRPLASAQAGAQGGTDTKTRDRGGRQREDEADSDRPSQHRRPAGSRPQNAKPAQPEQPAEVTQQLDVMSDDLVEDSDEQTVAAAVATGADVYVVSGHPRYHLEECPAIVGNDEAESLPIGEARELGFVPCGACRPDSELAEGAALPHTSNGSTAPAAPSAASAQAGEPELINAPPAVAAAAQSPTLTPPPAVAPPPGSEVPTTPPPAQQQPAADVPAVALPPAAYPPSVNQPAAAPSLPVAGQPPVSEQPPAEQPAAQEQVVVLPGKARFHRQGCRLVSGPETTESLDKADAVRQGYLACAICKP